MGTAIAQKLHLSTPLAMVTAGLLVGNDTVRNSAMSATTEVYVDKFWELLDMLLNTVLFVLIGMEMLVISFQFNDVLAGLVAIPTVLACRYLSLLLPIKFFEKTLDFVPRTNLVMTWGGLTRWYLHCSGVGVDTRDAPRPLSGNHLCSSGVLHYWSGIDGW